jgi:hypothetical protein
MQNRQLATHLVANFNDIFKCVPGNGGTKYGYHQRWNTSRDHRMVYSLGEHSEYQISNNRIWISSNKICKYNTANICFEFDKILETEDFLLCWVCSVQFKTNIKLLHTEVTLTCVNISFNNKLCGVRSKLWKSKICKIPGNKLQTCEHGTWLMLMYWHNVANVQLCNIKF